MTVPSVREQDSDSRPDSLVKAVDAKLRSGELETYFYYFKSIGIGKFSIFVLFCALNVFCSSFSRKCSFQVFRDPSILIDISRDMA